MRSLATINPELAKEWHPTKNGDLTPKDVTSKSSKKVWWVASKCGHEFEAQVANRVLGGCSVCSGKAIMVGVNDLAHLRPLLVPEWSPRNELKPTEVTVRSGRKVWWTCSKCNHEWESVIANRSKGVGCPSCAGLVLIPGVNDLESQEPKLAKEWDYKKNQQKPSEVFQNSNKPAWWVCSKCGFEWKVSPNGRSSGKTGCRACVGHLAIRGVNDLKTLRPDIAEQWSDKNETPIEEVAVASGKRYLWECGEGHEWIARVADRTREGRSVCHFCEGTDKTSAQEKTLLRFVESLGVPAEENIKGIIGRKEFDIYLPPRNMALEYNGLYWHSEKFRSPRDHYEKSKEAEKAGVQLLHIWEDDWLHRRPVVERMIARKLGVSKEPRYNARSLELGKVTAKEARTFLEDNHIQGFTTGSWYGTLQDDQGIKALLVMRKTNKKGEFYLDRFATSGIVRGGFSKLFKAFVKEFHPSKITTFSDTGVSDGSLYKKLGFEEDGELEPDYSYIVSGRRVHKFRYRKSKFKNDPTLKYEEGKTERELAEMNGLLRVYDAGKVRWVWKP